MVCPAFCSVNFVVSVEWALRNNSLRVPHLSHQTAPMAMSVLTWLLCSPVPCGVKVGVQHLHPPAG